MCFEALFWVGAGGRRKEGGGGGGAGTSTTDQSIIVLSIVIDCFTLQKEFITSQLTEELLFLLLGKRLLTSSFWQKRINFRSYCEL